MWKHDAIFGPGAAARDIPPCLSRALDAEQSVDSAAARRDAAAVASAYDAGADALTGCSRPARNDRKRDIRLARAEAAAWRAGRRSFLTVPLPRIVR